MKFLPPKRLFTWYGVAIFYFIYLFVLIVRQDFHPWLSLTFFGTNLTSWLLYFAPVMAGIYLFSRTHSVKIFAVCSALVFAPIFLFILGLVGLDTQRLSFALNWPVYVLLAAGRDSMTIPKGSGEVFLGGGWTNTYIYNANDEYWRKYQKDVQHSNQSKNSASTTTENSNLSNDQNCRVLTPLIGHWYLEYQQYGSGFVPCLGVTK